MTTLSDKDIQQQILACFIDEAREHLEILSELVLEIEEGRQSPESLLKLFRSLHTIKGSSRSVGLGNIGRVAHGAEELLVSLRDGTLTSTPAIGTVLFETIDLLEVLLNDATIENAPDREISISDIISKLGNILDQGSKDAHQSIWPEASSNLDEELVRQFLSEATELIELVELALVDWENRPEDREVVDRIFRGIHSIKGIADYTGLARTKHLTHHFESLLGRLRRSDLSEKDKSFPLVFESFDTLKALIFGISDCKEPEIDARRLIENLNSMLQGKNLAVTHERSGYNPIQVFITSSLQHLDTCEYCFSVIMSPDYQPNEDHHQKLTSQLSRAVTLLRNSADYMGFEELIIALDELVDACACNEGTSLQASFALYKKVRSLVANLENPSTDGIELKTNNADEPAASKTPKHQKEQNIKLAKEKLDEYFNLIGELIIARNSMAHSAQLIPESIAKQSGINRSLNMINRITSDLQQNSMGMRMIPIRSILQKVPRIVRDVAKSHNKEIETKIIGEETEVDRQVADALADPLIHLVRNSADHGIETPEARKASGKSSTGTITLKAYREGSWNVLEISDDGKGIDVNSLKAKAVQNELITQDTADLLSKEEALDLIFRPGLSTAQKVTDVSGRGVGMDVVKTNITDLGGEIRVTSEAGRGSSLKLLLPLTVAVSDVLFIEQNNSKYGIPMDSIKELLKISPDQINSFGGLLATVYRGHTLPLFHLRDVLSGHIDVKSISSFKLDESGLQHVVVLSHAGEAVGVLVDDALGQSEVVIKPLPGEFSKIPGLGGATIAGDGSIVLLLDPKGILGIIDSVALECANHSSNPSHTGAIAL